MARRITTSRGKDLGQDLSIAQQCEHPATSGGADILRLDEDESEDGSRPVTPPLLSDDGSCPSTPPLPSAPFHDPTQSSASSLPTGGPDDGNLEHRHGQEGAPLEEASDEGLHDEESYRHSLHAHHHNLNVLHAKIENLHDALTGGHSHEELGEASHKLCQDMLDVQKHYLEGPHHASQWRNPGDHHQKHRFEEHTIVSKQTSTDLDKHDYDDGYDPALHHEHGMLSVSKRGQYDERVREQNRCKEEDKRKRAEERSKSSAKEEGSAHEAEQFEEEEVTMPAREVRPKDHEDKVCYFLYPSYLAYLICQTILFCFWLIFLPNITLFQVYSGEEAQEGIVDGRTHSAEPSAESQREVNYDEDDFEHVPDAEMQVLY